MPFRIFGNKEGASKTASAKSFDFITKNLIPRVKSGEVQNDLRVKTLKPTSKYVERIKVSWKVLVGLLITLIYML